MPQNITLMEALRLSDQSARRVQRKERLSQIRDAIVLLVGLVSFVWFCLIS